MARILAVDDSQSMREMVVFTLESAGHEVVAAVDGVEALEICRSEEFDLVLTDVNMPNMDGIALVVELRDLEKFKFIPILVLTTESAPEKKQIAKSAGATGWIVKPFNPTNLLETVGKVTE